jgi:hypothetical protein
MYPSVLFINHFARSRRARRVLTPGEVLLSLPIAVANGERDDLVTALFFATSAVCVTGLITVDTAAFWSGFA